METVHNRLQSFSSWPPDAPVKPDDLARAGFFYRGSRDEVTCFTCKYQLSNWEPGDNPLQEHSRHNPNCQFLKSNRGGEVFDCEMIQPPDYVKHPGPPPNLTQTDSCMVKAPDNHTGTPIQDYDRSLSEGRQNYISPNKAEHLEMPHIVEKIANLGLEKIDYSDIEMRLATFKIWRQAAPDPRELAKAGFIYTGEGDNIKCYTCDTLLMDLGEDMNTVLGHVCKAAKPQPTQHTEIPTTNNPSMSQMGSGLEVRSLENGREGLVSPRSKSPLLLQTEQNQDTARALPSCQGMSECRQPREILFEPCGHFICCARCADNCQLCPSCKHFIQERLKLTVTAAKVVSQN